MKKSLLAIVQDIMNDMDGDVVNSFADTEESMQAAYIVRSTFEELMTLRDAPHLRHMAPLNNVSDSSRPNYLKLPENVSRLEYVAYNQKKAVGDRDVMREVDYLHPDEFLRKVNGRNPDNDNVTVIQDFEGATLNILNDNPPKYYTSFDDRHIVFDGWVKDISTTLTEGQSQAIYYSFPQFIMEDEFVPEIPAEWFPLLVAEAKSAAIYKLRQTADQKEEQKSKRQQRAMSQRGWRAHGGIRYNNYGRSKGFRGRRTHLPKYYE